jgi:opacity protein-like surface antigen
MLTKEVRRLSLMAVLIPIAAAAPQQPYGPVGAASPASTSFRLGAQVDPVGLQGPSVSPALYGANATLSHRLGPSPWEAALVFSLGSRHRDAPTEDEASYDASTYGLAAEVRYLLAGRVYGPYLVGGVGLANTRVDDRFAGFVPGVGTDATTAVLGGGVGLRFRILRVSAFADAQYQLRTVATHGRHALPVRLGFRW